MEEKHLSPFNVTHNRHPMEILALEDEVHKLSVANGWWNMPQWIQGDVRRDPDAYAELIVSKLALVHSEISEAVEAVRDGNYDTYKDMTYLPPKPDGLPIELADAIIRILDLAGWLGIDMEDAIRTKQEYNKTRAYRHGGKRV